MPESIRPFVGRGAELGELSSSLDEAAGELGSLWFVSGEPGIGKSRLVEEVARLATARGATVLWGRCWEAGGAPAYWPWVQVLRQLLRRREAADVEALLGTRASHLEQLLPELRRWLPDMPRAPKLEPEQARFQLLDAVVGVLCDAAVSAPLVVILEDLHAADPSSVMLLELLAGLVRGARLVVVGTYRDAEALGSPVGAVLARVEREARTIPLRRLGEREVGDFLQRTSGRADDAAVRALHRATEGHPLFLVELVRWLNEQGGELPADGRSVALPRSVSAAVLERIERLSPVVREFLETASVVGREFAAETVCLATPEPCTAPGPALREAVEGAILVPVEPGRYRFGHILIREALYRALPEERRLELHLRVAEALERMHGGGQDAPWSELMHHYLAAGPRGRDRGIESGARAAEQAAAQLAFEEAFGAYAKALSALDEAADASPVRRFELLIGLGAAALRGGHIERGRRACMEAASVARRLGDPELLARAALEYGSLFLYGVVDPELVSLLEEARSALGERDSGMRARVLARLASALQPASDPTEPFALARDAIGMARRAGDDATLLATLRDGVSALMDLANPAERAELNREHVRLADRLGRPTEAFRGYIRLVFDSLELGDVASVRSSIAACERLAEQLGHPQYEWPVEALHAMVAGREGRFEDADAHEARARALAARSRDPNAPRSLLLQRAHRLQLAERHEELLELLPEVQAVFDATVSVGAAMGRARVSGFLAAAGRPDEAHRHLPEGVTDEVLRARDLSMHAALVDLAVASGDMPLAERVYGVLDGHGERYVSGGLMELTWGPPVAMLLGRLAALRGRRSDAEAHLGDALSRLRVSGGAPHAAVVERELEALAASRGWGAAPAADRAAPSTALRLEPHGDHWLLECAEGRFHLKDVRGLHMLGRLLAEPGREVHVLDLSGASGGGVRFQGDAGEVLDQQARAEYRRRVEALREELQEAEAWNDAGRSDRARRELGFLESELARAVGLGRRERRAGVAAERARVNVQRRIRDAIRRIEEHAPQLARHLTRSVRTGTFCCYEPE
ncbi:MAG: ATP-binding protein [Myxococcota bacterium]